MTVPETAVCHVTVPEKAVGHVTVTETAVGHVTLPEAAVDQEGDDHDGKNADADCSHHHSY